MEKTQSQKQTLNTPKQIKLRAVKKVYDFLGDSFISKGAIVIADKHPSISYTYIIKFPYGETIWWCSMYDTDKFEIVR